MTSSKKRTPLSEYADSELWAELLRRRLAPATPETAAQRDLPQHPIQMLSRTEVAEALAEIQANRDRKRAQRAAESTERADDERLARARKREREVEITRRCSCCGGSGCLYCDLSKSTA